MLLMIFLVNTTGYYYIVELSRYFAKRAISEKLANDPTGLLVLKISDIGNNSSFQRIDKKEFRYQGRLYDILREIRRESTSIFICLQDTRETRLLNSLKRFHDNKQHFLFQVHANVLFHTVPTDELFPVCSGKLIFPDIRPSVRPSMLKSWSPPPELI
jgi:hypothetical protein